MTKKPQSKWDKEAIVELREMVDRMTPCDLANTLRIGLNAAEKLHAIIRREAR